MKRTAFLISAMFFAAASLAAQDAPLIKIASKRALTHETMWLMKRVGGPAPSPEGKWTVFSVTNPSYDEKEQSSDLWIVPNDGSAEPRQITFTKSSEGDVAWSPANRRIAFSAKPEGDYAAAT